MRALGSLSNRLVLVCVLLTTTSIGAAMLFVSLRLTREHDEAMARRLDEALTLVEGDRRLLLGTSARLARLVADLPKLKAAIATGDVPTVAPIVASYRDEIGADVLIVSDADGRALITAGDMPADLHAQRLTLATAASPPPGGVLTLAHPRGLLQLVSVPIVLGFDPVERLGTLSVGVLLDDEQARQLRASSGSEVAFALGTRVLASSLGATAAPALATALAGPDEGTLEAAGTTYSWHRYALQPVPGEQAGPVQPLLIVLRSTAESEATLWGVRLALAAVALLTALAASLASYAVARTITRPLASLTSSMREMARTGDLTRRTARPGPTAWDDEDVRVLAGTFDAMTEAMARFQQQAAERDRLSALGRLSTVIAHEIRNPLMIVRGALRSLTRRGAEDPTVADAAADIEEQVLRLDRVVNDVLDFTRPVQLDVAPTSLHAVCREAVSACIAAEADPPVTLDLDDAVDMVTTDGDRLRTVLVNIVTNAREATRAAGAMPWPPVILRTHRQPDDAVRIEVQDAGAGVVPEHAPQIFEPYFTTRRTGTGLGLAIARNIVEGLGGTIALDSSEGERTIVRIVLPQRGTRP